jgi:hypothetical protein
MAETALPGVPLWSCSYDGPNGRYAITIPAVDRAQLDRDAGDMLPGFTIDGRFGGLVEINK